MPTYRLCHAHQAADCARAFAAWRGFESPLRHRPTVSSCLQGGHRVWWDVCADDEAAARSFLPPFLAQRTEVIEVRPTPIP